MQPYEITETCGEWSCGVDPDSGREYNEVPVIVARTDADGNVDRCHAVFRVFKTYGLGDNYDPGEIMYQVTVSEEDDPSQASPVPIPAETLLALYQ